ncbi:hypothetical protein AMTR_s00007p00029260 [Amborella trichopoda]|uniref:Uncharacterized protein n=1 Tax=Amborella trichopoda TaxID=13333 RepID=W1PB91_AMBTC|nr:hypothetical protein AMTR_s00007p00029260 [Amborella trichopoda]
MPIPLSTIPLNKGRALEGEELLPWYSEQRFYGSTFEYRVRKQSLSSHWRRVSRIISVWHIKRVCGEGDAGEESEETWRRFEHLRRKSPHPFILILKTQKLAVA